MSLVRFSYTKIIYLSLLGVLKYIRLGVLLVWEALVCEMEIAFYKCHFKHSLFKPGFYDADGSCV